jgi:hypothetical protein
MLRIARPQMAWEGCAAIRTVLRAGANSFDSHFRRSTAKALAGSLRCSLHAAGAGSGSYSTPLRPHPRASRMPSQATSGWANVVLNGGAGGWLALAHHPLKPNRHTSCAAGNSVSILGFTRTICTKPITLQIQLMFLGFSINLPAGIHL